MNLIEKLTLIVTFWLLGLKDNLRPGGILLFAISHAISNRKPLRHLTWPVYIWLQLIRRVKRPVLHARNDCDWCRVVLAKDYIYIVRPMAGFVWALFAKHLRHGGPSEAGDCSHPPPTTATAKNPTPGEAAFDHVAGHGSLWFLACKHVSDRAN